MIPTVIRNVAALALLAGVVAGGCSGVPRTPYTAAQAGRADVGIEGARTFADLPDETFERRTRGILEATRSPTYLALSGGGGDGAFGAGVLNGWTASGRRPEFTIVSGVSTGALIAPFAFLGSRYDGTVRELYTSGVAEGILESPDLLGAVFGSSIFPNDRLRQLVARYVTTELIEDVARESERGRLLFVLTTNLDSQRPVLWDLGTVARARTPRAVQLFRDVLVASASIPAVFPPMLFDAQADGRAFQELHVDGSVSSNVFTLPRSYLTGSARNRLSVRDGHLYILLNTSPLPAFAVTENSTTGIAGRTISMGFKEQVRSDLRRTFMASRQIGFEFNVTYIDEPGASASGAEAITFDTARMRRLYDLGFQKARTGTFWRKTPPNPGELERAVESQETASR